MRVLVISRNAWDDTNSVGNTLSNFFQNLKDVEFANIYFRSSKPNNNVCKRYYRITEFEVIKKWFAPSKIGKEFLWTKEQGSKDSSISAIDEKKIIRLIHKYGIKTAYKISNRIWYSRKWLNTNLDKFIESFSPDLVVSFVKSAPQYFMTIKYLREKFHIPLFSWIADDEYTTLSKNSQIREIENLEYILRESAVVRGCSEEICEYYNSVFGCKAVPLYKGCTLSARRKTTTNNPIKIAYAGNLLYGRLDVIKKISEAIEKYTPESYGVRFEIYSNTPLSSEYQSYFDSTRYTEYMGQRDYEIIKQRLSESDIVLHAESFDNAQIIKTKYSFSTKIIDCLQCGSVLLAVGPSELSSIKYVKKIPGAFVIEKLDCLEKDLLSMLNETATFGERAEAIGAFAKSYHDESINSIELMNTFLKITKKGGD